MGNSSSTMGDTLFSFFPFKMVLHLFSASRPGARYAPQLWQGCCNEDSADSKNWLIEKRND